MNKDEELGSQDQKNLAEDMKLKRNGTELIGSNGSGLPEKLGKFTTGKNPDAHDGQRSEVGVDASKTKTRRVEAREVAQGLSELLEGEDKGKRELTKEIFVMLVTRPKTMGLTYF